MKWHRKINSCLFQKQDPQWDDPKNLKVYASSMWGVLTDFNSKGQGYIIFEDGGGQIVRNWNHFLQIVEIIETDHEK